MNNLNCLICKKEFHAKPYTIKMGYGKYCSRKCAAVNKKGKPFANYKGFIVDGVNLRKTLFYRHWTGMFYRCYNHRSREFPRYGGRGLTVSDEWREFETFTKDMYGTYRHGLTIDRVDNNRGYSKENCKWSTPKEQANNTKRTENAQMFTWNGMTKSIKGWSESLGVKRSTLHARLITYNWSIDRSLTTNIKI